MSDKKNIDELLNSFVDGEMSERRRMEVKRLAKHDASVAKRIGQIQTLRSLVGALPKVEVPSDLAGQLQELLESNTYARATVSKPSSNVHLRYVLLRRTLSIAAMVGLVLVLSGIVYTIVAPPGTPGEFSPSPKLTADVVDKMPIGGRLELSCTALSFVDKSVNRAIKMNGLLKYTDQQAPRPDQRIYRIHCGQRALCRLLDDIKPIWPQFKESTLHLNTPKISSPVVVKAITARQTLEVFSQDSLTRRMNTAKRVAVQNSLDALSPSDTLLALSNRQLENAMTVSVPRLAGRNTEQVRDYTPAADEPIIDLTIVLTQQK